MEETLTVPRLMALYEEWRQHPPLPIMVAAYLGIKTQQPRKPEEFVEKLLSLKDVVAISK